MSLLIYIAHTGRRLDADPADFRSVEELQRWITQQSAVPLARQVLMTSKGKVVKNQALASEQEIYVYDRNLFTASGRRGSQSDLSPAQTPQYPVISQPPDTLTDESSLEAWRELFTKRRDWSREVSTQAGQARKDVLLFDEQITNILQATAIAAGRVKNYSASLRPSLAEAQKWAESVVHEPKLVLQNWDKTLRRMSSVKPNTKLLASLKVPGEDLQQTAGDKALFGIISKPNANRAASQGKQAIDWLEKELSNLKSRFDTLTRDGTALVNDLKSEADDLSRNINHTVEDLAEEIETIVAKVENDCEAVLDSNDGPRSIASVSKTALLHTRNLLPSLQEAVEDLHQLLNQTVRNRNESSSMAVRYMQRISAVETLYAELKASVSNLEISDDDDQSALDMLTFINQLPFLYGTLLIESVRREEWAKKMRQDSSTLAEELAVYKDEEERRRKRWCKPLEHFLTNAASEVKVVGVEISLTHLDITDQYGTREDIDAYLLQLERMGDCEEALLQLRESFKDLDAPSKQQTKRANAFKNGSIQEATYGRNSLLLRGDEDLIQTIQLEKSRLEDRLRGSESRVRKLEDLLHRQSQVSRPPVGSSRPSLERQPSSPRLPHVSLSPRAEPIPFRPSVSSSRRVSQNHGAEEKALVQRLLQLESELEAERTKSSQSEQALLDQNKIQEALNQQIQEAASMKKDLMDNFEAQQTEFDGERRLLLTENKGLQMKLEELEEELDRISGSHDNKALLNERNQALETEIESLRKDAAAEFQTLQDHIKSLQEDQRERRTIAETDEKNHREERRDLEAKISQLQPKLQSLEKEQEGLLVILQGACSALEVSPSPPLGNAELAITVGDAIKKLSEDLQEAQNRLSETDTEIQRLRAQRTDEQETVVTLREQVQSEESRTRQLNETLINQKMRYSSLEESLNKQRVDLFDLRAQLSDGEYGPAALQSRISEGDRKVETLARDLLSERNHSEKLQTLLRDRANRAEEISQLLFQQTDCLTRLLEHIGFTVTRQDDGMVIQRLSRNTKDSALLMPSQSVERSLSGPVPTMSSVDPPSYIHWALAQDEEDEADQWEAFAHESKAFDLDAFCEAVTKRVKDTEHIARKWQREAKNYRERFHKAQFESQNKIAFRGFREGDLALFLPTRNQAPKRSWAAFNVGAPHYFLREQEMHRLKSRDWLLARISKIEERVVDLGKKNSAHISDHLAVPDAEENNEENPFGLSDGLRWYFLDAGEERLGAPSTPGMGKSTVASAQVDAAGSIPRNDKPDDSAVTRTLAKSLDSRRSSGNSRKSLLGTPALVAGESGGSNLRDVEHADTNDVAGPSQVPQRTEDLHHMVGQQAESAASAAAHEAGSSAELRAKSPPKPRAWDAFWTFDLHLDGKRN